jgi:hypothetical protein
MAYTIYSINKYTDIGLLNVFFYPNVTMDVGSSVVTDQRSIETLIYISPP